MSLAEEMRQLVSEMVTMYEGRVVAISRVISETYDLLNRDRSEREMIGAGLRDLLAEETSLRRRDFDRIIGEIFIEQNKREETIRTFLKKFLNGQERLAEELKETLKAGNITRVKEMRVAMESGIAEAKDALLAFREEGHRLMERLKSLLARGSALTVSEFKVAVREIKNEQNVASLMVEGREFFPEP